MRKVSPPQVLQLLGIDHLEWWVGNARAFSGFLASAFGFDFIAYAGPETGQRDRVSYLLQQGEVRFVVSGALDPDSPIAAHVRAHGDGVRDVAFTVDDAAAAYDTAVERGAPGLHPPEVDDDDSGKIVRATIAAYGDTNHTFVERRNYYGLWAPHWEPARHHRPAGAGVALREIDHVVANVELGALDRWVDYYERALGFEQLVHFGDKAISTEYSALMSTVLWNGDPNEASPNEASPNEASPNEASPNEASRVVLPINEPAEGRRKSQIEEYLDFYRGPGVQHIAMRTDDIVSSVRALRDRGVRFLDVPPSYYDEARERMAGIEGLPWEALAELGILVDRDQDGHLLQIFTETVTDRPTVFFEIIQREGARGFGEGNFKALFQAIEREQAARGNL